MPQPEAIHAQLATIANSWSGLALGWHLAVLLAALALVAGWRPRWPVAGGLLALPLVSVAIVSGFHGNPLNAALPGVSALFVAAASFRMRGQHVARADWPSLVVGGLLIGFALVYPHFLGDASLLHYALHAPLGLVPCPTYALVAGCLLLAGPPRSRLLEAGFAVVAAFYGMFGWLVLGVTIDALLGAGAALLVLRSLAPAGHTLETARKL